MAAENQVILQFTADTKGLKPAADQLLALGQITKEQYADFSKANQAQQKALEKTAELEARIGKAVKANTVEAKNLNDQWRNLGAQIGGELLREVAAEMQLIGASEKEVTKDTKDLTAAQVTLKQELRANTIELQNLAAQGKVNTTEYRTLLSATGELKDTIGDVNAEIATSGSDTRGLDKLLRVANAAAGAFSLVQGTMGIFASENENLQKALLKVNSAMAALNGLQAIQEELTRKDSLAISGYNGVLRIAKGLQDEFAISSKAAFGIIGAGIAVAVAAIYGLVQAFSEADTAAADFEEKRSKEAAELNAQNLQNRKDFLAELSQVDSEFFAEQESERKRREAEGQKADEVQFDQLTQSIERFTNRKKAYQQGYFDYLNLTYEEEKTRIKAFDDFINAATITRNKLLADAEKARTDAAKKAADDRFKIMQAEIKDFEEIIKLAGEIKDTSFSGAEIQKFIADLATVNTDLGAIFSILTDKRFVFKLSAEDATAAIAQFQSTLDAVPSPVIEVKVEPKIDDEAKKRVLSITEELLQSIGQIAGEIGNVISNLYDAQAKKLEEYKNRELQLAGDNAKKRAEIEKRFAIQQAEIAYKQAVTGKAIAITQAIINTALAVTKALTEGDPYTAQARAALAGVLGATQIAAIASTPLPEIPKFAKGTKNAPAGFKWVGEQGPELINDKGGYAIMNNKDSMELMRKYDIPTAPSIPPMPSVSSDFVGRTRKESAAPNIDLNALGDRIVNGIKNNPSLSISIDEGGFTKRLSERGKKTEIMNSRYRD